MNIWKHIVGQLSKSGCYVAIIGLFLIVPSLIADAIIVPARIQATMITKLVKCNQKLAEKSNLNMTIVYNSKTESQKNMLYHEMKDRMHIKTISEDDVAAIGRGTDIIYFMPGCEGASEICKQHKILSIAAVAKPVKSGNVSVAIALENEKPRVFVSLSSLRAEDHSLSMDILRIADVSK